MIELNVEGPFGVPSDFLTVFATFCLSCGCQGQGGPLSLSRIYLPHELHSLDWDMQLASSIHRTTPSQEWSF